MAHDGEHVVGRVRPLLRDQRAAVLEHGRGRPRNLFGCLERLSSVLEVERVLDPLKQLVTIGLRDAHEDADRLHRQLARDVVHEVTITPARRIVDRGFDEPGGAAAQVVVEVRDRAGRQSFAHEQPDPLVARVVGHVQHEAGERKVVQRGAAVRTGAARLRRVGTGIVHDGHASRVRMDRPEALTVGSVFGGLVPEHRCDRAQSREEVVREAVGEEVEIGEVDLGGDQFHVQRR